LASPGVLGAGGPAAATPARGRSLALRGPPGAALPGARGMEVAGPAGAAKAGGKAPRRVFLALGKGEIRTFARAPQHRYLVRSVEPVDPPLAVPHASYVTGRGPFTEADDRALLAAHAIDLVVAKNSGGSPAHRQTTAAR